MTEAFEWGSGDDLVNPAERELFRKLVDSRAGLINAAIERACEASIQEGRNGVLVERTEGRSRWVVHTSHPDVPYGAIYERTIEG